jgi:3'-5' exoribonuclease
VTDHINLNSLQSGQVITEAYLLIKKQLLTSKNGNFYGALRLGDASGECEAKLWERAQELLAPVEAGQVVKVSARVQNYQGQNQLILDAIAAYPEAEVSEFLACGPKSAPQMWPEFDQLVKKISDPFIKTLLIHIFSPSFRKSFAIAPAAKSAHHAYVGGLLEHTLSVGKLAWFAANHYPHLDRDLLLAGALLHDIGKVEEFSLGPPIEYTDAGRLQGHILLGLQHLNQVLDQLVNFPQAMANALRHLLISHHGQEAFGSPQKPKIPEGLVLHILDDLDAKTQMVQQILAGAVNGGATWSAYNPLLERYIYLLNTQGEIHAAYGPEKENKGANENSPALPLFKQWGE